MTALRARRAGWLGALLSVAAVLGAVLWLALDRTPQVEARGAVSHEDVARTLALLRAQDPRWGPAGVLRVVTLGERDLDLLLNHAAHRLLRSRVDVRVQPGGLALAASSPLPAGLWLNLSLRIAESGGRPAIVRMRIGDLPLPSALAAPVARWLAGRHAQGAEIAAAFALVQRVSFQPGRLTVVYAWDPSAPRRMLASLVPPDEQARLRHYREHLVVQAQGLAAGTSAPLAPLLRALFDRARERSDGGADAAAENRAALLTLTLFASGRTVETVLPAARDWPRPPPLRLTLAGREDFALHFLISAAIAVDGTSPLSHAVGVYKEVTDARGGSGFSFDDIAADRAGTRFGELARRHPRELQERLAAGVDDAALMPPWSDLPEGLPEAEFRRRFGDVGAPAYQALLAEIDRRIAALPLLR